MKKVQIAEGGWTSRNGSHQDVGDGSFSNIYEKYAPLERGCLAATVAAVHSGHVHVGLEHADVVNSLNACLWS